MNHPYYFGPGQISQNEKTTKWGKMDKLPYYFSPNQTDEQHIGRTRQIVRTVENAVVGTKSPKPVHVSGLTL
jgi:hypothetical protein